MTPGVRSNIWCNKWFFFLFTLEIPSFIHPSLLPPILSDLARSLARCLLLLPPPPPTTTTTTPPLPPPLRDLVSLALWAEQGASRVPHGLGGDGHRTAVVKL